MSQFPYTATTRQEYFNNVWQHYVVNGEPLAYDQDEDTCKYQIFNYGKECRCAIGIHLTDEELALLVAADEDEDAQFKSSWGIHAIVNKSEAIRSHFVNCAVTPGFLDNLQSAHDRAAQTGTTYHGDIKASLEAFASHWSLTIPSQEE